MVKNNYLVQKGNVLNGFVCNDMALTELRFFLMYISKLNPKNPDNRTISIDIGDFEKFFDVQFNTTLFSKQISKVLKRSVYIRDEETGELTEINLYSNFKWDTKGVNRKLSVTCNYDVVPYLFELKKSYTSYMIENIAKLNTVSKIRLYELCKQYEKIGKIRFGLTELREKLCSEMVEFKNFKRKVLDPAVKDVNAHTDIVVSYEKNLSSRKVVALTFTIVTKQSELLPEETEKTKKDRILESLYLKCDGAFTKEQLQVLEKYIDGSGVPLTCPKENYIYMTYCKVKIEQGDKVKNMFKYVFAIIESQLLNRVLKLPIEENTVEEESSPKPHVDLNELKQRKLKEFEEQERRALEDGNKSTYIEEMFEI